MSLPPQAGLPQAFFLEAADGGQRFCLYHAPRGDRPLGRVLYLHPFAEELNCTRRVVATQARALAKAGYAVLQIDLLGCGDSSGDFADATWDAWLADALAAHRWLAARAGGPIWLWGLRAGALLATQLASRLLPSPAEGEREGAGEGGGEPVHLLLWQPVASGQQLLQQFLRLHSASQWLGASPGDAPAPAQALAQGQTVHIAGYALSPTLAQGLGQARLTPPAPPAATSRLVWLELSSAQPPALGASADRAMAAWRAAGWQVQAQAVAGPAFWQTVDGGDAPALIDATLAVLNPTPTPRP